MSSKYGDGDGNLYSLDRYLDRQDARDAAWESIVKKMHSEVEGNGDVFKTTMDEFHELKSRIASELDEYGMENSDEVVMQLMYDCGDSDLLDQMNSIDW